MRILVLILCFLSIKFAKAEEVTLNQSQMDVAQAISNSIEVMPATMNSEPVDVSSFPCVKNKSCYIFEGSKDFVPVVDARVKLMGKGVMGRRTSQVLGLACVGEQLACDVYRFVYVVNPTEAYYVGPKFKVKDEKTLIKALKEFSSSAKDRSSRGVLTILGGMLVGSALVFTLHIFWPFVGLFALVFVTHESGIDEKLYDIYEPIKGSLVGNDGQQLMNHDGWNWNVKSRKIAESTFSHMLLNLQVSNGFFHSKDHLVSPLR